MFSNIKQICFPIQQRPQLIVVVDTEEEFNWGAPPNRDSTSVAAMQNIFKTQSICEHYNISPSYMVDYPIVNQEQGIAPLIEFSRKNTCEIGAHLHPWVTPPYTEKLSRKNMYPGNLPYELEYEKIKNLQQTIFSKTGNLPTTYKAGVHGFGTNTEDILRKLGFTVDMSVCPPYDFSNDSGPDYSGFPADPFWFGKKQRMLEIPSSGAFVGIAGNNSKNIYNIAQPFKIFKATSILSKLNIVDRLLLSPEGFTVEENIKLTRHLFNKGMRTFVWNFHSTSVLPNAAPYVRSQKDLTTFLDSFKKYFDFFFNDFEGQATTPTQLYQQILSLNYDE